MRFRDTNDLPELDPAPIADERDRDWYRFVDEIRALRASPEYAWADGQLARIAAAVERTQQITAQQRRAVERIRESEWAPGRAYQGYGRRWR